MTLPIARRIASEQERIATIQAAQNDNDAMHFPTHVVLRGEEIVGGWCLGALPLVMVWHKSDAINAKESLILRNTIMSVMNDRGMNHHIIACNSASPYLNHMERFGYKPVWATNLFINGS